MRKIFTVFLSIALLFSFLPYISSNATENEHDVELWNAVKPLETTVTFLNTGAHPDDERSDFLAYLSRGLGVKTASLIANRGEGGQNEIGSELGNPLGIIRSNEMIEAAKITGVKAYHLSEVTSDPIYDFGFSKSPEETLEKWGEELTYERFIRFIRTYKPDIVMPSFRNVDSQHGHHRAITILSLQAFEDAADPNVFPEHMEEGLSPWQIKKVYLPASDDSVPENIDSIEIGIYDEIYGMTYPQLGELSRSMHKSQGMGRDIPAEPRQFKIELVKAIESANHHELFHGVPYNFDEWADFIEDKGLAVSLRKLQKDLNHIIGLYPDRDKILPKAQKALKDIAHLINQVKKSKLDEHVKNDLLHKLEIKLEQLHEVSFVSSGLSVEPEIETNVLTKGEKAKVQFTITNHGKRKIHHIEASIAYNGQFQNDNVQNVKHLKPGESRTVVFDIQVPEDAELFNPYGEPVVQGKVTFKENGYEAEKRIEFDETVAVLPELGISLNPENVVVNTLDVQESIPVTVKVKNYFNGSKQAAVSLKVPEGWTTNPSMTELSFSERYEEKEVTFFLQPPAEVEAGRLTIDVVAESDGELYNTTVQEISYDHIKDSYYLYPSQIQVVAFDLEVPENLKIGYIDSGFDKVADYLANAGVNVEKLTEADLATGDLSQFDAIVTGVRAYLSRKDLQLYNDRLLDYVENGGHLVVQYHKPDDNWNPVETPPYFLEIGSPSIRWRVTDEEAPVEILQPDHKLFHYPNKITENDWDDWVQERGLYFPMNWDDRYETLVSMADPGEDPFASGILLAEYGEGSYLYTSLVFYRQLEHQVPGSYRIFVNLISYGLEE